MKRILYILLALAFLCVRPCQADTTATYNSATDIPITASSFSAAGETFSATLNFAPPAGTNLMVVKNTGLNFITGTFSNLAQGQVVTLSYGGIKYQFIANYYGGTGNDLVLQWAQTRLVAWGGNGSGQLGNNSMTDSLVPVDVLSSGVLARKTVVSAAAGPSHSLALCSDGTVAAWGYNLSGQLGNGSTTRSMVPVTVVTAGGLAGKTIIAVTAGGHHSLALCSDGTVAAWGANSSGQLGIGSALISPWPVAVDTAGVLAGKTVVAIAAGGNHSLALCSDGTVAAWGYNYSGQLGNGSTAEQSNVPVAVNTTGVLAGKTVVAIAAGNEHSLALCSDGTLATWGNNSFSQLGNSTTQSNLPVAVSTAGVLAGKTIVAIAAGGNHSLALCSDNTIAAWGRNGSGQLGNNSTAQESSVPVAVSTAGVLAGKTIVAIAAGGHHSLALCSDGTLATWGNNYYGQLGNNSTTQSAVPTAVSSTSLGNGERYSGAFSCSDAVHNLSRVASPPYPTATSLAATNLTTTGTTLNGTVNPNGSATTAQFEYGTTTTYGSSASVTLSPNDGLDTQNVSANLTGLTPGTAYHYRLTVTNAFSMVSTVDGTFTTSIKVAATFNSATDIPVTVSSFSAAGAIFSATLNFAPATGTTLMVVKNTGLNFINGTFSNLAQGQIVTLSHGGIDYRFIANYYGGSGNDLVLQWANTRPVAWGGNSFGQIGDNSTTDRLVPVDVLSSGVLAGKTVITIATGNAHSLALCSDGTVAAWGNNSAGQLGNNSTSNSTVPVAVNTAGVLSGKTVIAVAAGRAHSLALCSDGTVAAWGANVLGQLGNDDVPDSPVPFAVSTAGVLAGKIVVAVAAGEYHSLALCSDGKVAAWGANSYGQLGANRIAPNSPVPALVSTLGVLSGKTVIAVAAGGSHSLALCSDGSVAAWGQNDAGQLGNNGLPGKNIVPVAVYSTGVLSGKTVVAVAAGNFHSLVRCSDNTVAAWGANNFGQLGTNSTTTFRQPVLVNTSGVLSGKTIVAVAAGQNHSLALCSDGTVAAWGYNNAGQLGNNTSLQSTVPVAVSSSPLATEEKYVAAFSGSNATHNFGLAASPRTPVVSSLAATNLTSDSATLNGTVNAASGSAAVAFDYGLDSSYGSSVTGVPSSLTGSTDTPASAIVTGLTPKTTYHYRVRATISGGAINGADLTFTTLPDTTGPVGGTMTLAPGSPVDAGSALAVTFANWTDPSTPLTYSVLLDDVIVSAQGASATRNITAPATAGTHTLKGRVYDALGHFTEITQSFTVITTQEEWRTFHFGTALNEGDAADLADPDCDGANNLFEYVAGLVPTRAQSRFNVRVEPVAGQPAQKAVIFSPVLPGRTYTVKYKESLTDENWTPLADIVTSDSGTERTVTDFSAGNGLRFYRVEITRP